MYDACVPWPERPKGAKDKSRGPKGLKLEVGARRAPQLLLYIFYALIPGPSHLRETIIQNVQKSNILTLAVGKKTG